MYNFGDKFKVIGSNGHYFNIGEIVTFMDTGRMKGNMYMNEDGKCQILDDDEVEIIKDEFKVGDMVRINGDLTYGSQYDGKCHIAKSMLDDRGEVREIVDILKRTEVRYRLKDSPYFWTDKMFKRVHDENEIIMETDYVSRYIHVGDYTISIPKDIPYGISKRHPKDDYNKNVGKRKIIIDKYWNIWYT